VRENVAVKIQLFDPFLQFYSAREPKNRQYKNLTFIRLFLLNSLPTPVLGFNVSIYNSAQEPNNRQYKNLTFIRFFTSKLPPSFLPPIFTELNVNINKPALQVQPSVLRAVSWVGFWNGEKFGKNKPLKSSNIAYLNILFFGILISVSSLINSSAVFMNVL